MGPARRLSKALCKERQQGRQFVMQHVRRIDNEHAGAIEAIGSIELVDHQFGAQDIVDAFGLENACGLVDIEAGLERGPEGIEGIGPTIGNCV